MSPAPVLACPFVLDRGVPRIRALVGAVLALAMTIGACADDDDPTGTGDPPAAAAETTVATTSTVVVAGDPVNRLTLVVGDCFTTYVLGTESVTARQRCDTPHLHEVFAAHVHPARFGEAWPGDEALQKYALRLCYGDFEAFVGEIYELSELAIGAITPPQTNWEDAKARFRTILCYLTRVDGTPVTTSLRGARI